MTRGEDYQTLDQEECFVFSARETINIKIESGGFAYVDPNSLLRSRRVRRRTSTPLHSLRSSATAHVQIPLRICCFSNDPTSPYISEHVDIEYVHGK